MYRRILVTLECEHLYRELAVREINGAPYDPDYTGREMFCNECGDLKKAVSQVPPAGGN